MKDVVVTGATGFVGRHLRRALGTSGYRARGLARSATGNDTGLVQVDYDDAASLSGAVAGADCVVHVAGLAHVDPRQFADPEAAFRAANVVVACNVARACVSSGVPRLVLLSSAGVLGTESPAGGFTDDSPARPHDPYTRSKLAAEREVADIAEASGLGLTILRPPMIYGPGAPGSFARLSRMLDSGWPLPVGAIGMRRSLIGIDNLCDAIIAACESPPCGARAILVADEPPVTVAQFARELARARARRARIVAIPGGLLRILLSVLGRQADYRRLFGAFELRLGDARERLGWTPRHTLAGQLAAVVREGRGAGLAGRGPSAPEHP